MENPNPMKNLSVLPHFSLAAVMVSNIRSLKWGDWVLGIWAAVIGGGAGAVAAGLGSVTFDVTTSTPVSLHNLMLRVADAICWAAVLHLALFLQQNPTPKYNGGQDVSSTTVSTTVSSSTPSKPAEPGV